MTAVSDSVVFRSLFSTPQSAEIWSDQQRTRYYLQFEAALATIQAQLGIIPKEAGEAIILKCKIELIDIEELGEETRKIGYPVLPLVKQIVRLVNKEKEGLGEWTHWGATTQVNLYSTFLLSRDQFDFFHFPFHDSISVMIL